jgi:hypothetical protein
MLGFKRKQSGPPDAAEVAGRARILGARIVHAMAWPPPDALPAVMANWSDADRADLSSKYDTASQSLRASLESSGLWAQASPDEKEFFRARLTERTQQQCVNASWSVESVACCLWALGVLSELPAYDTESSTDVCKQMPQSGASLSLRSAAELEAARAVAQTWHWRSRTRGLIESGKPIPPLPNNLTLDQVVRLTARAAAEAGDFAEPCDEDFPAFGKAYRDLSPDEYAKATSIASERHKALNWICGFAPDNQWDRTPTDT